MIGRQKRALEHTVSSQPVKYQKHFDDNLLEANTRVAACARCDSREVVESALASELHMPLRSKVLSELENCMEMIPRKHAILLQEYEAVNDTDNLCVQKIKEAKIVRHEGDSSWSFEELTKWKPPLPGDCLMRDKTNTFLSGLSVSLNEKTRYGWGHIGKEPESLLLAGDALVGLDEGAISRSIASTNVTHGESGSSLEARDFSTSGPLPVLMNEKVIDLRLMHEQVTSFGGYQTVTSDGLWGKICLSLGLGTNCGPGLKLIYFKYLGSLEGELLEDQHDASLVVSKNTRVTTLPNEKRLAEEKEESHSLIVGEQFAKTEPLHEKLLKGGSYYVKKDGHKRDDPFGDGVEKEFITRERQPAKVQARYGADWEQGPRVTQGDSGLLGNCSYSHQCDDIPLGDHSDSSLLKEHSNSGTGIFNQGKTPEDLGKLISEKDYMSLADTLIWIKRMALEPGNPHMGQGAEVTVQNEEWVKKCASQAVKVRAFLWKQKEDIRPGGAHSHQAKQILAPSLYYEIPRPEQQSLERLWATRERVARYGSPSAQQVSHESANLQRVSSLFLGHTQWAGQTSRCLPRQSHFHVEERYDQDHFLDRSRKRIPTGPDYQARIPVWRPVSPIEAPIGKCYVANGMAGCAGDETQSSDEDREDVKRWLGKLIWPPPGSIRDAPKDQGQDRSSCCSCLDPESLSCVRLHILEARDRLKQELGQAFYVWKFDQMGESVACQWTKEEEQTFRALVKMNPPSRDKNFWDQLPEAFAGKKMTDFVSYYFNVFVFRRRATQNRLDCELVDSDDDETVLPEENRDDSEDYDSGERLDNYVDEDASDEEDEIERQTDLYEGCSSAKLVEDTVSGDISGANLIYSSKMDVVSIEEDLGEVPMISATTSLMSSQHFRHGYRNLQDKERGVRLHSSHMTARWGQQLGQGDEEQFEAEHLSIASEDEPQELKTWEVSHWNEADHEDVVHGPPVRGASCKGQELTSFSAERNPSPYNKAIDGTNQHTSLGSSCEAEGWGPTLHLTPRKENYKLLSTNGMIQEFFGDEGQA